MKKMNSKEINSWLESHQLPFLEELKSLEEVFWVNPNLEHTQQGIDQSPLTAADIKDAEERLERFAPYISKVFPETKAANGIIESPLVRIPSMQQRLADRFGQSILGELLLKCDSHLPISGSIKARGGIYEILKRAEELALSHHLLTTEDDYSIIASEKFQSFFS